MHENSFLNDFTEFSKTSGFWEWGFLSSEDYEKSFLRFHTSYIQVCKNFVCRCSVWRYINSNWNVRKLRWHLYMIFSSWRSVVYFSRYAQFKVFVELTKTEHENLEPGPVLRWTDTFIISRAEILASCGNILEFALLHRRVRGILCICLGRRGETGPK